MEEDRRKQNEQRNRILEEEMQKFQRQREELLRLVGERKADRRENARPLPDDIYSGGEASEEDLRNLVTVDNEITKTGKHTLGESQRNDREQEEVSDAELGAYFIPRRRLDNFADENDRLDPKSLQYEHSAVQQSTPNYREEASIDLEIELLEKKLAMVKKVRDRDRTKLQGNSVELQQRIAGGRGTTGLLGLPKERSRYDKSAKELNPSRSTLQRTVESRKEIRDEDSYSDRREFKVQTHAQDGLYRFQADDNQKLESRNCKDRMKFVNKSDRMMDLHKQSKQSRNDFDFYSTDPYVRKETKKQHVIFSDPIQDERLVRNERDCLIKEEQIELKKTYESSIQEMEDELRRREKELEKRESWIKLQEKKKKDLEIDSVVEGLKKKETELQQKLALLTEREIEIEKKEASLRQLDYSRKVQDETEEKEYIQNNRTYLPRLENMSENSSRITKSERAAGNLENVTSVEMGTTQSESTQTNLPENKNDAKNDKLGTQFSFPKFTVFSGEEPKPKTEATYEEWLYEVQCVQKDGVYSDQAIGQAIRKSLKGQAKQVLMPIWTAVTIEQILNKLEAVFGNVATGESVMQEFYTATQNQGETVTAWSLRLEDIVQKAVKKGHVRKEEKDKKLRDRFWNYLRNERLKNATRTKYEKLTNFEDLRRAVREEENDMKARSGVQHQLTQQGPQINKKEISEDKLDQIMAEINNLKQQMKNQQQPWRNNRRWYDNRGPQQHQHPQGQNPSPAEPNKNTEKKSEN